jgi:GAF domain-containing protein
MNLSGQRIGPAGFCMAGTNTMTDTVTPQPQKPVSSELAQDLARLVNAIELGGRAILPSSDDALLQSIVAAAARIFGAAAAAILLVDADGQSLVFRVAVGRNPGNLIGTRIPIDKGIAGYVAMTGQPIAVSNTQQDARFNVDFAKSTGYIPDSILATPLLSGERVIGVMEVLDKIDAASFGIQDMEVMGLFAQQAALAIEQSQQMDDIGRALLSGLKQIAAGEGVPDSRALSEALEQGLRSTDQTEDLLAIAGLFNDLSNLGRSERRAALKTLTAFAELSRSRRRFG